MSIPLHLSLLVYQTLVVVFGVLKAHLHAGTPIRVEDPCLLLRYR